MVLKWVLLKIIFIKYERLKCLDSATNVEGLEKSIITIFVINSTSVIFSEMHLKVPHSIMIYCYNVIFRVISIFTNLYMMVEFMAL